MCPARSLRTLSPSPRTTLVSSPNLSVRKLLQTTPKIGKDLRRYLAANRRLSNCRSLTTPIPSCRRASLEHGRNRKLKADETNLKIASDRQSSADHHVSINPIEFEAENVQKSESPGFSGILCEFDFPSPGAHSPNCVHPSPSRRPLYTPDRQQKFLGRGSFGNVSLCNYQSHRFALKIVNRSVTDHIGDRNLLGIRHAHIVTVLRVTEVFDKVFVCMEFAGHYNLQHLLDYKSDLDIKSKFSFAQQVASGLNHCHKHGIIHGDVKPANVIISPLGECKLGDFGLSIRITDADVKCAARLPGTAAYAAPEVLQGKNISTSADVYSFGITLWQIYTNEVPFAGEHPHAIIYKVVSQNVRPVFTNFEENIATYVRLTKECWKKNPEDRPTSLEVLSQLKELTGGICQRNANRSPSG